MTPRPAAQRPASAARHEPLAAFLAAAAGRLAEGPTAIVLIEDGTEIRSTLAHHLARGFRLILAVSPDPLGADDLPDDPEGRIVTLRFDTRATAAHVGAVDAVIAAAPPDSWLYYGYNAEYLFYPFCETRSVGEMLAFHAEERRRAMLTCVVDLYAADLGRAPDGVDRDAAMLDAAGYYALGRQGKDGATLDRQLDLHGGLRWRFEDHIPRDRRRIDRIGLFRTQPGLRLLPDHRLSVEELNTHACPWHHNLTAAIASFRVAKALARNPGSRPHIAGFVWHHSMPFRWHSQQLMDLGLMEPGQWF